MNLSNQVLTEFEYLEARIGKASSALTEASFRLAAMEGHGPILSPGLQGWASYVQELEHDFACCLKMLEKFLSSIHWGGLELPLLEEEWIDWWNAIRRELKDGLRNV